MITTANEMRDFRKNLNAKYMRKVKKGLCTKKEVQEQLDILEALITAEETLRELHKYKLLEAHGRLLELPCRPDEEVWVAHKYLKTNKTMFTFTSEILNAMERKYAIGYTKEEAEAKLAELKGE